MSTYIEGDTAIKDTRIAQSTDKAYTKDFNQSSSPPDKKWRKN